MVDMEASAPAGGGHVVLCGLNELGYRTLEELVRLGEDVVVIVRSPAEELARGARELGATLVPGNYRDQAVLRAAGTPVASALVVTEDDDVGNLHAALAAQELNPGLRLRLRMFNRELGRRVQELFEDCQVFDAAALAVPAFVSAALLQDWQQRVEVDGRMLVVRPARAAEPGVLLPLARVHPDGTADLFPDTDEQVLCLAEAPPATGRPRHPRRPLEQPGRLAAAWTTLLRADIRLRMMTAIVLGLTVTGIGIFGLFSEQNLDLIDAIYFTVTIMTMASTAARLASGDPIAAPTGYAVAKAGVVQLIRKVAKEVAGHGVRVNCVSPSTILTERLQAMIPADRRERMMSMHPLGRLGTPEDVAYGALFLASESSSWITGVTLDVAGGQIMV
jgi:NAD(P)-dependent dehydrogenase (short-subunit alcohol dehydrogenase family)